MRELHNWLTAGTIGAMLIFGGFFLYKTWNRPPQNELCGTTIAPMLPPALCKDFGKPWWR